VRPISPNTLVNYRRYADQKLLPALGRLPLNRVDTATIDRFYAELRQRGSKCQHCYRRMREGQPPMRPGGVFRLRFSGEERVHQSDCVQGIPMTASAIRNVHAVLSGAFKQAMVWGWISHNPVPLTTRRRSSSPTPARQGDILVAGSVIILPGQPLLDRDVTKTRTKRRVAVGAGTLELLRTRRVEQAKVARWPRELRSAPTPTSSAVRPTAPGPSALTGCPMVTEGQEVPARRLGTQAGDIRVSSPESRPQRTGPRLFPSCPWPINVRNGSALHPGPGGTAAPSPGVTCSAQAPLHLAIYFAVRLVADGGA
jgi:hypothetical protein